MKVLIRIFSEITVKSPSVRRHLISLLRRNLQRDMAKISRDICISGGWDSLEVKLPEKEEIQKQVFEKLKNTSGIEWFAPVHDFPLKDEEGIFQKVKEHMEKELEGKSFCVRVKRNGIHNFTSVDLEKYVGRGINQQIPGTQVRLKNPEITVSLIVRRDTVFLHGKKIRGMQGFPVGSQGKVLVLLSGGFDSGVVAHMMMNRGCKVDYLFCNLGGMAHEAGVRNMAHHLWKTFSQSFPGKIYSVPFEGIIKELLENTDQRYRGILLKRMMIRAAEKIARKERYKALVTGESLAQVSSQTLSNLASIDHVTEMLVLRPLIGMNKPEIIEYAKRIGTAEIATSMPEYCGVVSQRPATNSTKREVITEEEKFDMSVLGDALSGYQKYMISEFKKEDFSLPEVRTITKIEDADIVIDIREKEEIQEEPLKISGNILDIPFYEIQEQFPELNQEKTYALYCERGIISKAQAELLIKKGFRNVSVLRV